jgi:hypothetical protein
VMAVTDIGMLWRDIDFASAGEKVGILKAVSQKALKWILIGSAAAVAVTQFYYVQEMLAALVLFAVLFSCIAAVLVLLFISDRAGQATLEFLELHGKNVLQHARAWRTFAEPRSGI